MPSLGLNTAFSLATNLLGVRADPYQAFNFLVEIESILAGGFSECSGLQVETELYEKIASKIRSLSKMISEEKQCAQRLIYDHPYTFLSLQTKTENVYVTLGSNVGCLFAKKVDGVEECCALIEQIRGLLPIDEFVRGH